MPFLGCQSPAGNYLQVLSDKRINNIRDRIKGHLIISADGTIILIVRVYAMKGTE